MAIASDGPSPAAGGVVCAAAYAPVLERLEALVGLAPSEVLANRLRRCPPALLARLSLDEAPPPALDQPDWAALLDAVTVQETRLFRAAPQLEAFRTACLPALVAATAAPGKPRPLRLLSAGCASGEEAWTLAILGHEAMAAAGAGGGRVEVLGLDICRPALAAAAAGRYRLGSPDPLREVPDRVRPLLPVAPGGDWVEPAPELRPLVRFARANLLALKPTEAPFDAILCRNVLIYLTDAARRAVLQGLAAALRPGGALLLGATDSVQPGLSLRPWREAGEVASIWRREAVDAEGAGGDHAHGDVR